MATKMSRVGADAWPCIRVDVGTRQRSSMIGTSTGRRACSTSWRERLIALCALRSASPPMITVTTVTAASASVAFAVQSRLSLNSNPNVITWTRLPRTADGAAYFGVSAQGSSSTVQCGAGQLLVRPLEAVQAVIQHDGPVLLADHNPKSTLCRRLHNPRSPNSLNNYAEGAAAGSLRR